MFANASETAIFSLSVIFISVCGVFCYLLEIYYHTPWPRTYSSLERLSHKSASPRKCTTEPHGESHDSSEAPQQNKAAADTEKATEKSQLPENKSNPGWHLPFLLPGILWMFAIIPALHSVRISALQPKAPGPGAEALILNPDVGGIGIRIGLYIPACLALIVLPIGCITQGGGGGKEVSIAQLLNLFYLNFNSAKAAGTNFQQMTFVDLVVACISIDFTSAGLQMTSSMKEALSARWVIGIAAVNQIAGLALTVAMLASTRHRTVDVCYSLTWWGSIDSCHGPSVSTWLYIATRSLILAHGLWLDCRYTLIFDEWGKDWEELSPFRKRMYWDHQVAAKSDDHSGVKHVDRNALNTETTATPIKTTRRLLSTFTRDHTSRKERKDYQWPHIRSSAFSKWIEWYPAVLVAIPSLEVIVRRLPTPIDAVITDWGQSASLVLAATGVMHWTYVMYGDLDLRSVSETFIAMGRRMFSKKTSQGRALNETGRPRSSKQIHQKVGWNERWSNAKLLPLDFPRSGLPVYTRTESLTLLEAGIRNGAIPLIRSAFRNGATVTAEIEHTSLLQWTMVHRGESDEDLEIMNEVFKQYPSPALERADHRKSSLIWAITNKRPKTALLLIQCSQDVNTSGSALQNEHVNPNDLNYHFNVSALEMAALEGMVVVFDALIERGVEPTVLALYLAVTENHGEIFNRLMQLDVLRRPRNEDTNWMSPNKALLKAIGAGPQQADMAKAMAKAILEAGANAKASGKNGAALIEAIERGYPKAFIELLLDHGAGAALIVAIRRRYPEAFIKLLLDHGADVETTDTPSDRHALQIAASGGLLETVDVLLQEGANVNYFGGPEGSALQAAVWYGHTETVELLLERGAETESPEVGFGGTALQAAAYQGHLGIVQVLLQHGAAVNAKAGPYGTALQAADNAEIRDLLLRYGAKETVQRPP